jgi:hypothetical protein
MERSGHETCEMTFDLKVTVRFEMIPYAFLYISQIYFKEIQVNMDIK